MLVHAAVLDKHHVARFPFDAAAIMDVVPATLDDEKAGRLQMAVLSAIGARCIGFDMALNSLRDFCGSPRRNGMLAIETGAAFPGHASRRNDTRRFQQLFG